MLCVEELNEIKDSKPWAGGLTRRTGHALMAVEWQSINGRSRCEVTASAKRTTEARKTLIVLALGSTRSTVICRADRATMGRLFPLSGPVLAAKRRENTCHHRTDTRLDPEATQHQNGHLSLFTVQLYV